MIVLKWYRIQDLPIHWSYRIKREEIELVTDYNINDVLGTDALVKNQQKELDLRAKLSEMYGIDLRNMSRSSIGKNLMTKFYSEWSGMPSYEFVDLRTERSAVPIKKIVKDSITFKTPFIELFLIIFRDIVFSLVLVLQNKVSLEKKISVILLLLLGKRAFNL